MKDYDRMGSVVLEVFETDAIEDYRETYNVRAVSLGPLYHGIMYRFTGRRVDLACMVAECWDQLLTFDKNGMAELRDLWLSWKAVS